MTSALSGTICTPMIMTMNAVRPWKPKRATATAARKADAIEIATTVQPTTIRLFMTSFQKNGTRDRVLKFSSVNGAGNPVGRQAQDVAARLERRRDHPVDREDHHQRRDPTRARADVVARARMDAVRRIDALASV